MGLEVYFLISGKYHSDQSIFFSQCTRYDKLLGHLNIIFMNDLKSSIFFPPNLEGPVARSLSLQFILQSLLESFKASKDFQSSALEGRSTSKTVEKPHLERLLDKLFYYVEILIAFSSIKESEIVQAVEEMRKSICSAQSKMMVWKKQARYPLKEMLEQLMHLFSNLFRQLSRFFHALVPFLREARSDENVLLFLIENRESFNQYLGMGTIEEMLSSFFPAGFDQLRAVIFEGYTKRGFSAFFTEKESLIEQIQWETPCQSQNLF